MSKKAFKSQASSSRAAFGAFDSHKEGFGNAGSSPFQGDSSSLLSYVYEPPNLSRIEDPSIVIFFKNIQKKDATTKAKALEELQSHVQDLAKGKTSLGGDILEAWVSIYPRTSIDSSRRVRQLAHILQGQISLLCGKGIAKYLPRLIGAWLAGLNDNDKLVANAASDAFKQTFSSEDKQRSTWRIFRSSILHYCDNALFHETVASLSDERTTSPDDAEAKYARVVGSSLLVLAGIVEFLPLDDVHQQKETYLELLGRERLWKMATNQDPFIRRSLYRLLVLILQRNLIKFLVLDYLSKYVVIAASRSDQRGSAYEYSKMLAQLSRKCPEVWKVRPESTKESPHKSLCQFLAKGSQGAPADFWKQVLVVIRHVPQEILSPQLSESNVGDKANINMQILEAIQEGLLRKEESRFSQVEAWDTYLEAVTALIQIAGSCDDRSQLLNCTVTPLVEQYLRPDENYRRWVISGSSSIEPVAKAVAIISQGSASTFNELWSRLSNNFIQDIRTSLPEQSQDHVKSQGDIGTKATKWYNLQALTLKGSGASTLLPIFASTTIQELNTAADVLVARKGKPYGAADTIAIAVRCAPQVAVQDPKIRDLIVTFLQRQLVNLALSPSLPYLVTIADIFRNAGADVQAACNDAANAVVSADSSSMKSRALKTLLASPWLGDPVSSSALGTALQQELEKSLRGGEDGWDYVAAAMANPAIPVELAEGALSAMTSSLSIDGQLVAGLRGLDISVKRNPIAARKYSESSDGPTFLSRLLLLSDSPDDKISSHAQVLYKSIEEILTRNSDMEIRSAPMILVIRDTLMHSGPDSVSVETLVEQATKILQQSSPEDLAEIVTQLLPGSDHWSVAVKPFLADKPNPALAMTNALGGALYLIDSSQDTEGDNQPVIYDLEGYSLLTRIVLFAAKILKSGPGLQNLNEEKRLAILALLSVFAELATDGLSVASRPGLWNTDLEVENEMANLLADTQLILFMNLKSPPYIDQQLLHHADGMSIASYYHARAYTTLLAQVAESRPSGIGADQQRVLESRLQSSQPTFNAIATMASGMDLKLTLKLCNSYIDAIAGTDPASGSVGALRPLTLFNCLLSSQEDLLGNIPQRRLVLHVKHLSRVLQSANQDQSRSLGLKAEVYRNLVPTLMRISDIYGEFWEEIMASLAHCWSKLGSIADEGLPVVYASLKLYSSLEKMSLEEEVNDDFKDSWIENRATLTSSLISLMMILSEQSDEFHQPMRMANDLLLRLILKKAPSEFANVSAQDLYPIMACGSSSLQEAAFHILQEKIPSNQEQLSIEAALSDGFIAKIPGELLTLIVAPPVPDSKEKTSFQRELPLPIRTYLLGWILTFNHWKNASYKLQTLYADCIKDGSYLKGLMGFTFDQLITRRPRPVDASRFLVDRFDLHEEDSPDREFHWLLCHIYYLCLLHLPLMSRAWWRDDTSRQLQRPVEEWTGKYITPTVIANTLNAVATLTSTIEEPLEIKVQPRAKEVVATYPIDDQFLSIKLPLPPTYPLASITVLTSSRVGIEEKKWHSWLLTISGIINFPASSSSSSNAGSGGSGGGGAGAILDGILVWRKNIEGALRGQSECSICYSVVGADRQLPNKRCGTCRNFFHGGCLFRWFRSSNSSSCPLCRNAFNYS